MNMITDLRGGAVLNFASVEEKEEGELWAPTLKFLFFSVKK